MSIWSHMNDMELQTLREAHRAVQKATDELAKIDSVRQATEEQLQLQRAVSTLAAAS